MIHTETVRILGTQFTVGSNRADLIERLGRQTQRAAHDLPLQEHRELSVMWEDGEYRITGDGAAAETEFSLRPALDAVFARLHRGALEGFADHIRIHAASGMGRGGMGLGGMSPGGMGLGGIDLGGMVLLVGDKRAGKTTLAAHLLLQGFEMLGDEMVLLRNGVAVTFPRRFNLRQSALALLPGLQGLIGPAADSAADSVASPESLLVAVDPLLVGQAWRIRPARVAAVVFIEPNHGGTTHMRACPKVDMVRRVLAQCSPPSARPREWVADLCQTINAATTVSASLGDLPSATRALRHLFV